MHCLIQLNNVPLLLSDHYVSSAGYSIFIHGRAVRYEVSSIGLIVEFDGWNVNVTVSSQFAGLLQGLCGNYDGNRANDLTTADGVDVSGRPNAANLVGDSFAVPDPEETGNAGYELRFNLMYCGSCELIGFETLKCSLYALAQGALV
jgi:hypothetical protein